MAKGTEAKKTEMLVRLVKSDKNGINIDQVCGAISDFYLENEKHAKRCMNTLVKKKIVVKKKGIYYYDPNFYKKESPQLELNFEEEIQQ